MTATQVSSKIQDHMPSVFCWCLRTSHLARIIESITDKYEQKNILYFWRCFAIVLGLGKTNQTKLNNFLKEKVSLNHNAPWYRLVSDQCRFARLKRNELKIQICHVKLAVLMIKYDVLMWRVLPSDSWSLGQSPFSIDQSTCCRISLFN